MPTVFPYPHWAVSSTLVLWGRKGITHVHKACRNTKERKLKMDVYVLTVLYCALDN